MKRSRLMLATSLLALAVIASFAFTAYTLDRSNAADAKEIHDNCARIVAIRMFQDSYQLVLQKHDPKVAALRVPLLARLRAEYHAIGDCPD